MKAIVERDERLSKFKYAKIKKIEAKGIDMLPVRVTGHVRFQYCQDLFLGHFDSTWLLPDILCLTDKEDHKHASKHGF